MALAQPITLMPGFKGVIAAYGFTPRTPGAPTNPRRGRSTSARISWSSQGPGSPVPPASIRPSWGATPSPTPTLPAASCSARHRGRQAHRGATPYTVTIDATGFDLEEGKDFGVLPPSFIAGNVRGHLLVNGQPQNGTRPARRLDDATADRHARDSGSTPAAGRPGLHSGRWGLGRQHRIDGKPDRHQPRLQPAPQERVPDQPLRAERHEVQLHDPGPDSGSCAGGPAALRRAALGGAGGAAVQRDDQRPAGAE